jgi:hypothetical protein
VLLKFYLLWFCLTVGRMLYFVSIVLVLIDNTVILQYSYNTQQDECNTLNLQILYFGYLAVTKVYSSNLIIGTSCM